MHSTQNLRTAWNVNIILNNRQFGFILVSCKFLKILSGFISHRPVLLREAAKKSYFLNVSAIKALGSTSKKIAFLADASAKALTPPLSCLRTLDFMEVFFECKKIYMFLEQQQKPEMDDFEEEKKSLVL